MARRPGRRGWGKIKSAPHAYRRFRLAILARDGYVCQIKGPKCTGTAVELDHVIPLCGGGDLIPADEALVRAACRACNRGRRDYRPVTPSSTEVEQRTVW